MRVRTLIVLILAAWVPLGCGSDREAAEPETVALAGMYEVKGTTVEEGSGNKRQISGTIILSEEGSSYTATFNLKTQFPTPDGPVPADVIGKGEGSIAGGTLEGSAQMQIVMSSVPGIDTQFAFVPRFVGPRIVSESVAQLNPDGTISVEIRNQPGTGEEYIPTLTTLRGVRVSTAGLGKSAPDVAAPPPAD